MKKEPDYLQMLKIAGAEVHCFEEFETHQGDWWSKVTYKNVTGWVRGTCGSCDDCDAFKNEINEYETHSHMDDEDYRPYHYGLVDGCEKCEELKLKIKKLGGEYLDGMLTQQEAEKKAEEFISWDLDAKKMIEFIKENKKEDDL